MRVGVAGKGGVGKTTVSATLARLLARRGHQVVAVDCDSDPNLALNLGLGEDVSGGLRPFLDQTGPTRRLPEGLGARELVEEYGYLGPDGVRVLLAARIEKPGSG